MKSLPQLDPREHKLIEEQVGRPLSNEEAQAIQHQQRLQEATARLTSGPIPKRDVLRGDV